MFKVTNIVLATTLAIAAERAAGAGCYPAFSSGGSYESGSLVSFNSTNYKCVDNAYSAYCTGNQPPGEPGTFATVAWSSLGACSGTQAVPSPTAKPTPPLVTAGGGGCPQAYSAGTAYDGGEEVSFNGIVYKCKGVSGAANWCGSPMYEPETGTYWEAAWSVVGGCSGVIPPTTSPTFNKNAPGCPGAWTSGTEYEGGDQVAVGSMLYECSASHYAHCKNREPGTILNDEAWKKIGSCDGTIAPTVSPTVDANAPGCPLPFSASTTYEGGDKASIGALWYECKAWPYTPFCNIYEPDSDNGALGWIKKGSCDGTIQPTVSPTHAGADSGGCNHPYAERCSGGPNVVLTGSACLDTYVAGVRVEYNDFIFECKNDIHASKYCKWPQYGPDGIYWSMAWNKIGWCDGTLAPTKSPSATPSLAPSAAPSLKPSAAPSDAPSLKPSAAPSDEPSLKPSAAPSLKPSAAPSDAPSLKPSAAPSLKPSAAPSDAPSLKPSAAPSLQPSNSPSTCVASTVSCTAGTDYCCTSGVCPAGGTCP